MKSEFWISVKIAEADTGVVTTATVCGLKTFPDMGRVVRELTPDVLGKLAVTLTAGRGDVELVSFLCRSFGGAVGPALAAVEAARATVLEDAV